MDRLLLVDGNSLAYRAYYATAYSPAGVMKNRDGIPVNAVLALTRMIVKTIDTYKPTHIFIAFDAGKKTFRHDKLESYKDGRSKTPDELIQQMPIIKTMFDKMNIKHYELAGIEADDILGSLACKYAQDIEVFVLSSDKDMYQLVDSRVSIIVPQNGIKPDLIINHSNFFDIHGYMPYQVPDIKGLVGDSSDNLPGVVGIGPKGAVKLIQEHESLERIFEATENMAPKLKEKLETHKNMSLLCKEIATIKTNVETPFNLEDFRISNIFTDEAVQFYESYHLNSLVKVFKDRKPKEEVAQVSIFDNLVL